MIQQPFYAVLPIHAPPAPNSRKKFSSEEDKRLKELVELHGAKNWDKIAELMPGRTGRQCRDRYRNYLIPGFKEFGPQWAKMTPFFHGRSANSLKNRWNYFVCRTNPIIEKQKKVNSSITTVIQEITLPPKLRMFSSFLHPTLKIDIHPT